jgi:indole-3-glycerol phosphate synthase
MTDKQEKQWRYAKALEIAARIIGPEEKDLENPEAYLARYERLVPAIEEQIRNHQTADTE